jgi:hypothetical protein
MGIFDAWSRRRQRQPQGAILMNEAPDETISALAARLPLPLEQVTAAAHELRQRIAPDAIPMGKHSHRIGEARTALAIATADLSTTAAKFHRVSELLRVIED